MLRNWCLAVLATVALTIPASPQVSIYLGLTPPPIRYEAPPPPPPAPEFVWVSGYWAPEGRHYRWVGGHYERPPFPGAYWTHPHYDRYARGWEYHEGYWGHEDHRDHDRDHDDDEHGRGHAYGHYKDHDKDHDH